MGEGGVRAEARRGRSYLREREKKKSRVRYGRVIEKAGGEYSWP